MYFTFTESAKKDIKKLPRQDSRRLKIKLLYWQDSSRPLDFAKPLTQHIEATHRFRLGTYRILVKQINRELRILRVRHRKDAYQR